MIENVETGVGDAVAPSAIAPSDDNNEPRTFEEMGLHPELLKSLAGMGFAEPMEVQRKTFRRAMAGKDILVQSRTGSGKTAAFGIPFAQGLVDAKVGEVQALCLCPTRELALQVATECSRISAGGALQVVPVYGGAPMGKQIEGLKAGAQIVAGTPGRVLDHLRRGTLKLDGLKVLVLDEADEMLSMGFYEEISEILKRCPTERQTLLFSATIPDEIERISRRHMRDPEKIQLSADFVGVHEITHAYYMVSGMGRAKDLVRILAVEKPDSAIIFCNTREETNLVAEHLRRSGLDAEAISSDLTQKDRERVMGRMKAGNLHYLVATDIAARGIDITALSHVFNYTFPESAEVYVHRTGRTGRAGKSGIAISLIAPRELGNFYYLKLTYKIRPMERMIPSEEEIVSRRDGERIERLSREVGGPAPSEEWLKLAQRLWASAGGEAIVARLLSRHFNEGVAPATVAAPKVSAPKVAAARAASNETSEPIAPAPAATVEKTEAAPRSESEARRQEHRARRERERDRGRGRDRDRRPGRDRDRDRSAAPTPPPARRPLPGAPTIEPTDGREFWEAWVDDRNATPSAAEESAAPVETTPPAPATEGEARPPKRPREELPPGSVRLYFSLGRRDGVSAEDVENLVREKGVAFNKAELHNSHTYLVVEDASADSAIAALTGMTHRERNLVCERARR
jgi:ATP-dependent RNA helicase DeaD